MTKQKTVDDTEQDENTQGRQAGTEIEITDEMMEAPWEVIHGFDREYDDYKRFARDVFLAMLEASRDLSPKQD